jgi:hypothetical protein
MTECEKGSVCDNSEYAKLWKKKKEREKNE